MSDDNSDISAASLWISHCSFSSPTFPAIVMITFDILSERTHTKNVKDYLMQEQYHWLKNKMAFQYILCQTS